LTFSFKFDIITLKKINISGGYSLPVHTIPTHQVQCLSGHIYNAAVGSELEADCKKREQDGFIDALILSHDECEVCLETALSRARQTYQALCGDWGCMGDCGAETPNQCQGEEGIERYQLLLNVATERNRPPMAA